ncbi:MAG: hypothetical protein H0X29_02090 [Parachlamydiaceae bacterium]|nr:hypothetical protein [Parachlamydiaceae bacterium]
MKTFRKIQIAMTLLLATSSSYAYEDYGNIPSSVNFGDAQCCESTCCESTCCGKGFISADFLYWRTFEDGLDDCFPLEDLDQFTSSGRVETRFIGKGRDPHFNWNPGFRIGAGYQFGSGIDVAIFFTDFHSRSNRNRKEHTNGNNHNKRHWKLDLDVIDVTIGREFNLGTCFTWRPFGGLRGVRIEQKLRTNFSNFENFSDGPNSSAIFSDSISSKGSSGDLSSSHTPGKQRFLGIGPLVGLGGDWNIGKGFSIYANASYAFLYGRFHVDLQDSDIFLYGTEFCSVKKNLDTCQSVFDAQIGIQWQTCYCSNIIWVKLGLEHHQYFNQNRIGSYGDLCLDGPSLSIGIEF